MTFPLKNGSAWALEPAVLADLEPCYPYLSVPDELAKAKGWLIGNPTRRKTAKGMLRFLTAWLARADMNRVKAHQQLVRQRGPAYATRLNTQGEDWFTECKRLHNAACLGQRAHATRLVIDAGKRAKLGTADSMDFNG